MRASPAPALCALALALTGCGAAGSVGSDFEGEERRVAEAVGELRSAATGRGPGEKVCGEVLSRELAARVGEGETSCAEEIEQATGDADLFQLQVTDVTVSGDSATARAESSGGGMTSRFSIELTRQDGGWRVAGISSAD